MPYCIIVAGDEWVDDRLLSEDLSRFRAVVRFEPSHLSAEQEAKLAGAGGRLVTWSTAECLIESLGQDIEVAGTPNVSVLPRFQPENARSPLICHLLNSNYDPQTDHYQLQSSVRLTIGAGLLGRVYTLATLYAPGRAPVAVDCRASESATAVAIPGFGMWAILKLE